MGRPPIHNYAMTGAERVRRHRTMRARDAAALPLNQIFTGHAAEVMAAWPAGSIDLIVTSPPYWDAVKYDGAEHPWRSYEHYLDDMQTVWAQCARVLRPSYGRKLVTA
jgi:DNA modification methylase